MDRETDTVSKDANRIIANTIRAAADKPYSIDSLFVDFDSTRFHISTPASKSEILLSMELRCWNDLKQFGVEQRLAQQYAGLVADQTEPGAWSISFRIDLAALPQPGPDRDELIKRLSLVKRNALAVPFEKAFETQRQLEANPPGPDDPPPSTQEIMAIHYRPEETIYLLPSIDRVTVIFSTIFKEETDRIFGKVFLQEFVDARRRPSCQSAPQVLYSSREPPREVRHLEGNDRGDSVGFVTFVIFPRHFDRQNADATITQIQMFRDYLHYHIKCSKAYMQSRMRARVASFLKILNRARLEKETVTQKTASGRTFVRA